MYPVKLGHKVAIDRINRLTNNGHHAEALVTSVFTLEKVLRRTLKELVVSAGFTSTAANLLMKSFNGQAKIRDAWPCFDPDGESLPTIVGNAHWHCVPGAIEMRNKLVHGERAYDLSECESKAKEVLEALAQIEGTFQKRYGYSGWSNNSVRRVSKLHVDPRVRKSVT